ncbi:MAG: EAL domain-containing protein [Methylococcales bacterium]|nr:EAL domain-containing protein [Methylococcales bacterium]
MVVSGKLKEKIIIIAENDKSLANEISLHLNEHGFSNIRLAENGSQIYEILRSYYTEPEKIGLIIVNDALSQCDVREMCMTLSNDDGFSVVPCIVLCSDKQNGSNVCSGVCEHREKCLSYKLTSPVDYSELLIVVGFQLNMTHERLLRHKQEERLINELAERKVVDAKLKYIVVHDELTNLLNRQNFERQLRLILNRSNIRQQNSALLFIDIDRFSLINEIEGFEVGDKLLIEIVAIIRKETTKNDLFARIGSDEFCLFLEDRTAKEMKQFADKIRQLVYDFRFFTGDVCYSTSLSIGISRLSAITAVYHPNELISRARQACILAKENGRNMVWEYNEKDFSVQERHRDIYWVPLIRKALLEKDFFLVFQPVVDLLDGRISHYEVLIRMRWLGNEVITPDKFIPVAERMGLIHSIDQWVVEKSIDFLADLPGSMSDVSLAINLSSVAFQDRTLLPTIKEKLELSWVDAKRIIFEITETSAVENFEHTREMITKIRTLGCKFALDDFGAGFCSFNYLKSFPVDFVKIDGQFIQNMINDETDQILVKSMVEIATKLGKKTIAEFVEGPETIEKLREIGVNFGQGYILGKPKKNILSSNIIPLPMLSDEADKQIQGHFHQVIVKN